MSSRAMKWAQQQRIAHGGLTHLIRTLGAVADKNGCTWRSQATLADQMAVTERCIRKYLRALERLGMLQRAHRSNGRGGRTSDVVRLRLDRQFTLTRDAVRTALQPEQRAGRNQVSNRNKTSFQPEQCAGDKGSDQQKVEIYQEEHPQDYQSAQRAHAGEKPTLAVVRGGRA